MKRISLHVVAFLLLANLFSANSSLALLQSGDYDGLTEFTSQGSGTLFGTLKDKDTDLPIPGAQVTVTNSATGDIVFTGTTDVNGDFKFDDAVQGTNYSVEYWREHFYTVTIDNVVIGSTGLKNVNAEAALKISANGGVGGSVITDDQLQIKNADINVYPIGGSTNYNTKTDNEGIFFVPDLPPGEYNVWPSSGGSQLANSVEITVNEMLKWHIFENITSPLNSEPGSVTFQVNTEDGSPVQNAKVTVPGVGTKFSDSNGQVEIAHLPEGTYTVTAGAPDHYSDVKTLQVTGGVPASDTFSLNPTVENKAEVAGNVRDAASNEPVSGVNVELKFESQSYTTTTNEAGDFKITDVPALGCYTATYSKTGYHTTVQKRDVKTVAKATTFKNVLLANKVEVHGAICIKIQSKQVQNNINDVQLFEFGRGIGYFGATALVGADVRYLDGEIVITNIPVNADLLLIWLKDGSTIQLEINVEDCHMIECTLDDSKILTKQGSKIYGKVKDQATGNSAETAFVSAEPEASSHLLKTNEETAFTNLNGEFVLYNLIPENYYNVFISSDLYNTTQFTVKSPEDNSAFYNEILMASSLSGTGAVAGFINGLGWDQQTTVSISSGTSVSTLQDGSYLINNIPPGEYVVTSFFGDVEKNENVTIENGITKQINFQFYGEEFTSVEKISNLTPTNFALWQNYPNPFNPTTIIRYDIPGDGMVELSIYDLLGRKLLTLVNEEQSAGNYEAKFIARNFASGVYIYKIVCGNFSKSKKMLLLK